MFEKLGGKKLLVYQTDRLKENAKEPTQLDIERIIDQRSYHRTSQQKEQLRWLEAGEEGERIVFNYLEKYGKEDWVVIRNLWMNNGGPFEADFILLTNHGSYLLEVKNYTSDFIYEEGIVSFNEHKNSGNPIFQTRRNTINLENICLRSSNHGPVQGALILVGADNYTEINSRIDDIDIVDRTQLRHYIQQIVGKDHSIEGEFFNKKYLIRQFERFEINRYHGPNPVSKETINHLKKGIQCPHCKSFYKKTNQKIIQCTCGFMEEREIAVLRTICEYGVLNFTENLKIGELVNFLGGAISRGSLRKILRKYFQEVRNGRYTYYTNLKLPIYKLYKRLNINNFVQIKMSYQDYDKMTWSIN